MTDTQQTPDPRSLGYYGRSWEEIKSTDEGLSYRLSILAKPIQEAPKAYKGISPQDEMEAIRIDNASREDTLRTRPTLDEEIAKEDAKTVDWHNIGRSQMAGMGIDPKQYDTRPIQPRWFTERMEEGDD